MAENLPVRERKQPGAPAKIPRAPTHLTAEAKRMWRDVVNEWVLGADALPLLRAALEQWDVYQRAREDLQNEGLTVLNRETGVRHKHPAAAIAKDSLQSFRMLFRQLGLEPPREP